jgi:hypothetical protein
MDRHPPPAFLLLELAPPRLASWARGSQPQLLVDGRITPAGWGRNGLPVPPGRHLIAVSPVGRMATGEQSTIAVDVHPGQYLALYYAASSFRGGRGAIGFAPVRHPGRAALLAIIVLPAALGLLLPLLALFIIALSGD